MLLSKDMRRPKTYKVQVTEQDDGSMSGGQERVSAAADHSESDVEVALQAIETTAQETLNDPNSSIHTAREYLARHSQEY